MHLFIDVAAVRGQHAYAARAKRLEGGEGGGDRIRCRGVRLGRRQPVRHPVGPQNNRCGGAAIGKHVEPVAGENPRGGLGQQRFHRRQGFWCHLRVVGDAGHEQIDTLHIDHGAEFVLDGVV